MGSLRRRPDFRALWIGASVSQFGTYASQTVLPLVAAGTLAATPWQMGLLAAAEKVAFLLIGLPAGAWVDRMRRRPVLIVADFVRAGVLLSLPLAWWFGALTLSHLVIVAILLGTATLFFDVAAQSFLPSLVGRTHLPEANAKLASSDSVSEMAAPPTAGLLAQWVGAPNSAVLTSVGYLASAAFLSRVPDVEPLTRAPAGTALRAQIAEGWRFVFGHPLLRPIALCSATSNFFHAVLAAAFMLFLLRDLDLSTGVAGVVLAAAGVGALLAALTARAWNRRLGQARVIWLVPLAIEPLGLLIPLAAPGWRLAFVAAGYAALAYAAVVYDIAQVSFRQTLCPNALLGRMNATIRFVVWGVLPVGGLVGGLLGEWIGVRGTLVVATISLPLAALLVVCSPLRGMRDLPDEAAAVSP